MHRRSSRSGIVLLALVPILAASACGRSGGGLVSGSAEAAPPPPSLATSSSQATTTAPPPPPTWPLTGRLVGPGGGLSRGAAVIKVDNSPAARPHAGLNDADVVYELQVEGITRFMLVVHSGDPDRIGPVRSARSSDLDLLGVLHRPLLIWSGGNPGVTEEVSQANTDGLLVDVGHPSDARDEYYRDTAGGRVAPHNLYTSVAKMRAERTPAGEQPPGALFAYRAPTDPLPGAAGDAAGLTIDFGLDVRVDYVWDAERGCWDRFQVDEAHPRPASAFVDEAGTQVCVDNVVVLFLDYDRDPIDVRSPKAISVGAGEGVVLSSGKLLAVRWDRPAPDAGWGLTDAATGAPVALAPGRTWVALPQREADAVIPMDPATAEGLLALRR